jgi:hypothetical protein
MLYVCIRLSGEIDAPNSVLGDDFCSRARALY